MTPNKFVKRKDDDNLDFSTSYVINVVCKGTVTKFPVLSILVSGVFTYHNILYKLASLYSCPKLNTHTRKS